MIHHGYSRPSHSAQGVSEPRSLGSQVVCRPVLLACPRVYSNQPNRRVLPQVLLSDAFVVLALQVGKASLFSHDVGVFWVLVRLMACGATGLMAWVASTGQLQRKRSIEVRYALRSSSLQPCSCCLPIVVCAGDGFASGVPKASRSGYCALQTSSCSVRTAHPRGSLISHVVSALSSSTNSPPSGSSHS